MFVQVVAAFLAIFTFSVVMDVPRRYLLDCGFIGAAGWLVYLLTVKAFGVMLANLLGAASITLIAHLFARTKKAPVTVFLIPGFLTLVPGASLYRSVYHFFIGTRSIGARYLIQTLQIAGMIALGIFVVDSMFDIIGKQKEKGDKDNEKKTEQGTK